MTWESIREKMIYTINFIAFEKVLTLGRFGGTILKIPSCTICCMTENFVLSTA